MARIYILGAFVSSTTSLAVALATQQGCRHEDTDAHFSRPADPPFTTLRAPEARLARLLPRLEGASWIFSVSAVSWAMRLEPLFDLIVFLRLDPTCEWSACANVRLPATAPAFASTGAL